MMAVSILVWLAALATTAYSSDLDTDKHALISFKNVADLGSVLDNNWTMASNPCTDGWVGVWCVEINRVTRVKLEGLNLSGSIPLDILGLLDELRVLVLPGNGLTGGIPADLTKCTKLKKLILGNNRLSGSIPDSFSAWPSLDKVDLSHNQFSGKIPASMKSLKNKLLTLRLEGNQLDGNLMDVSAFSELIEFNVSWNNLEGRIPQGMSRWDVSSYLGNSRLCGKPMALACPSSRPVVKVGSGVFITCMALAAWLGLSGLLGCGYFIHRRRKHRKQAASRSDSEVEQSVSKKTASGLVLVPDLDRRREFDLTDLLKASAYLLGRGTLGSTFKAELDDGVVVAVKRVLDKTQCEKRVFERRMKVVGGLAHPNLLQLRAYYFYSRQEKVLVHDYMPNGSLSTLLAKRGATLEWSTRLGIARGVAECLLFLHTQCKLPHGNIKPSNILLDERYQARLSDFGLCHFAAEEVEQSEYRAPELKVSRKADIFSFGMVLFELLTGRLPAPDCGPNWALLAMKNEWDSTAATAKEQMLLVSRLATLCTSASAERRPKAMQVTKMIEETDCWSECPSTPTSTTGLL